MIAQMPKNHHLKSVSTFRTRRCVEYVQGFRRAIDGKVKSHLGQRGVRFLSIGNLGRHARLGRVRVMLTACSV